MAEMALGSWQLALSSWLLALGSWLLALVAPRSDRIFSATTRMHGALFLKDVSPVAAAAGDQGPWISNMMHRHALRHQIKMNRY